MERKLIKCKKCYTSTGYNNKITIVIPVKRLVSLVWSLESRIEMCNTRSVIYIFQYKFPKSDIRSIFTIILYIIYVYKNIF